MGKQAPALYHSTLPLCHCLVIAPPLVVQCLEGLLTPACVTARVTGVAMGKRVLYTTPLKALSNQKYSDFSAQFGAERVGLLTGLGFRV
jgi:hypothetical protein